MDELEEKYGEKINIVRVNTRENGQDFYEIQMEHGIGIEEMGLVPKVFIGDFHCTGANTCGGEIEPKLIELGVEDIVVEKNDTSASGENTITDSDAEEVEISYLQLFGLAIVDAVNPCEIAVLVILITAIIARERGKKGKALKAGLAFAAAVFLMYLIFGLLIIFGFKSFMVITDVGSNIFYTLLAIAAIILGLLNLKDAFWYGGGGFVMEVPQRWRPLMKKIIIGTTSVKGAFVTGLIVSFFLTPCTAGPYFVAGGILAHLDWAEAILPLLFYLIIFISPMILIIAITYFGFMAIRDIGAWRQKNVKLLHLVAGLLLLGLGLAMLLGFI